MDERIVDRLLHGIQDFRADEQLQTTVTPTHQSCVALPLSFAGREEDEYQWNRTLVSKQAFG